jgi:hypothetical protein
MLNTIYLLPVHGKGFQNLEMSISNTVSQMRNNIYLIQLCLRPVSERDPARFKVDNSFIRLLGKIQSSIICNTLSQAIEEVWK